ncbi:MAG TPA: oligosaccharide flippase family protein [Terracidiphilus sp.]|nr:oligosaccharide flippase family protein [Terracidiphilus sp.]
MRRSVVQNIAWNYGGYAYQIAINLGVTAYVVRHVSVPEYGLYLLVLSISATLYLLDMGLSNLLVQGFVAVTDENDKSGFNQLLASSFVALAALGLVGVAIFYGLSRVLPGPFNIPHPYVHEAATLFILASFIILAGFCSMAIEQAFRASHRFDRLSQAQLISSTVQAVGSFTVLAMGKGIVALAAVQVGASTLQFAVLVALLPHTLDGVRLNPLRFRMSILRPFMHFGFWAFINNLSGYLFDMLVWVILGSLGTMTDAAIFGLASKAPRQLWNMVDKGASVALPLLSETSSDTDKRTLQRMFFQTQTIVFGAVLPFVILGAMYARPIIHLLAGDQYAEAVPVMQWLLLAAFSHAVGYASDQLLYACGEVKKAASISFCGGALSVLCALVLVPTYGATGLAAGVAITQLVVNCVWFTYEACRVAEASLADLISELLNGLLWPLVVLIAELGMVWGLSNYLSPNWLLVFAIASGVVYLGVWGFSIALPLYRSNATAEILD